MTITSTESSPSFLNPIPLTFTFSEVVTGFAVGDITVGAGGSIGNFAGSGAVYTADLTITTALATVTVDVAQNVCVDGAGNQNTAATQFSITSGVAFFDKFTTADDAPVTTPRTAEPGPGALDIVDTDNLTSIAGGAYVLPSMKTANTDPRIFTTATTPRSTGKAAYYNHTVNSVNNYCIGWRPNNSSIPNNFGLQYGWKVKGASLDVTLPYGPASATSYQLALINNSIGGLVLIKGGAFTEWSLMYPFKDATYAAQTDEYAGIGGGADANITVDEMKIVALPAPFTTNYGMATNAIASPGVNEATTQVANGIVEMTWQAVTGQTWNLYVRQSDGTHNWIVRADQGGSTIKLIENNAGETERASAAQTWTNGTSYRVVVIMNGNNIWVYVAETKLLTYTSATFNNTATGVVTDRAGVNLVAWPLVLSGTALSVISGAFP